MEVSGVMAWRGQGVLCASADALSSCCESFSVCVHCGCDARALGGTCANDSAVYMKRLCHCVES